MKKTVNDRANDFNRASSSVKMNKPTRKEITPEQITLIKEGNHESFGVLFNTHYNQLVKYLIDILGYDDDAKEIAQDVFCYVWENRSSLDPEQKFESYLYVISRNRAMDLLKHKKVQENYYNHTMSLSYDMGHSPEELFLLHESEILLKRTLDNMPPQRRKIFELSRMEKKTYEEIAAELNITSGTVHSHMKLALRTMRKVLGVLAYPFCC